MLSCTERISQYSVHSGIINQMGQMAERLGNRSTNQKVAGSLPGRAIDVV